MIASFQNGNDVVLFSKTTKNNSWKNKINKEARTWENISNGVSMQ